MTKQITSSFIFPGISDYSNIYRNKGELGCITNRVICSRLPDFTCSSMLFFILISSFIYCLLLYIYTWIYSIFMNFNIVDLSFYRLFECDAHLLQIWEDTESFTASFLEQTMLMGSLRTLWTLLFLSAASDGTPFLLKLLSMTKFSSFKNGQCFFP